MSLTEIIFTIITTLLTGSNIAQFFYIRSNRQKQQAEADSTKDCVLYKRIEFLEERITKIERLVCFNQKCENRI